MLRLSVNPRLYALAALTAACATLAAVVPASAPAASPKSDSVQLAAFHSRFGGSRYGGAITAAKFLEEFVGDVPWVHLDIAGPAWAEHESATRDSGGTGCFVRTLVELARTYEMA